MKRRNIINLIIVLILGLVTTVVAANLEPGSEQDPIVTKSYVDEQIEEIKDFIEDKIDNLKVNKNTSSKTDYTFEPIKVNKNLSIIGKQGTEIIVRSGEGKAITLIKDGIENGLQDITDGVDLRKDEVVPLNHLIIIPRDDGRGIKFTVESYIMIRGDYTIK